MHSAAGASEPAISGGGGGGGDMVQEEEGEEASEEVDEARRRRVLKKWREANECGNAAVSVIKMTRIRPSWFGRRPK